MIEEGELIGHGAQAKCYKVLNKDKNVYEVIKFRLPKKYRHPKLDERINTARVKSEAKTLTKVLKNGIKVPQVLRVLPEENKIVMEYIDGIKLKDQINKSSQEQAENIIKVLAQIIKKLHSFNIIHGDLTTSNMIYQQDGSIVLLDFGLSSMNGSVEDKAVDLYLFERAFVATHPHMQELFGKFLENYQEKLVLNRLDVVRQRGRKKVAFG